MKKTLTIFIALLSLQANAEPAKIACEGPTGQISVRYGQCLGNEDRVKVYSTAPSSNDGNSSEPRVACEGSRYEVTIRRGKCLGNEDLIKVMD